MRGLVNYLARVQTRDLGDDELTMDTILPLIPLVVPGISVIIADCWGVLRHRHLCVALRRMSQN